MMKSTRFALAFLALAGLAGSTAFAQDRMGPRHGMGERMGGGMGMMRLDRMDADDSGDITFEEFAEAMNSRMGTANANNDGKMTVEEIAVEIQRVRAERMARRMIERFDTDGDGALTTAEVESRQKKRFALFDRNDDDKISDNEMPRRGREGRRN